MSPRGQDLLTTSKQRPHLQHWDHFSMQSSPGEGLPLRESALRVLCRVGQFPDNGLGINLRLTALVSKLATFPQPLLKAVLLHPDLVVQPSCSTLIQAICEYRHDQLTSLILSVVKVKAISWFGKHDQLGA